MMYDKNKILFYALTVWCMACGISDGAIQSSSNAVSQQQPLVNASPQSIQQQPLANANANLAVPSPIAPSKSAEDTLYHDAVFQIFSALTQMNPQDFNIRFCGSNCQNLYQMPFSNMMNNLRYMRTDATITPHVVQNVMNKITQLQTRYLSYLREQKPPLSAYVLTELSEETKERLKKGERILFPSNVQLQNTHAHLVKIPDVELLFFQKTKMLEQNIGAYGTSIVSTFKQKQNEWIQSLHQTRHQHVRSHMENLLNNVCERLQNYNTRLEALTFLQNALPESDRAHFVLPFEEPDATLAMAQQFLKEIQNIKTVETGKPFDDDSKKTIEDQEIKKLLEFLSRTAEQDTRQKTIKALQTDAERYLTSLPDISQLKKQKPTIARTISDAANQEYLDIGGIIFEKSSKDIQALFNKNAYAKLNNISDQDLQNAFNEKRLTKNHIRLLLLQSIVDSQQPASFKNATYDQKIPMVFNVIGPHLAKLQKAADQVDAKKKGPRTYGAMIQEEDSFLKNIREMIEQKSPKVAILEGLKNLLSQPVSMEPVSEKGVSPASLPLLSSQWVGSATKPIDNTLFPNKITPSPQASNASKKKDKPEEKKQSFENKIISGVKKFSDKITQQTKSDGGGIFGNFLSKLFG